MNYIKIGGYGRVHINRKKNIATKKIKIDECLEYLIVSEITFLAMFKNFENIVQLYGFEINSEFAEITLELYDMDLEYYFETRHTYNDNIINIGIKFIKDISRALHIIHSHHIVHTDIKPTNILLKKTNDCFVFSLCDFGLAVSQFPNDKNRIISLIEGYYAPELLDDTVKTFSSKIDVFSAGACFFDYFITKSCHIGKNDLISVRKFNLTLKNFCTENIDTKKLIMLSGDSVTSDKIFLFLNNCLKCSPTERWTSRDMCDFFDISFALRPPNEPCQRGKNSTSTYSTLNSFNILYCWIIEVSKIYQFKLPTILLCLDIAHRLLHHNEINCKHLQIYLTSCLHLASKLIEYQCLEISDYIYISDNAFNKNDIILAERDILEKLNYILYTQEFCTFFKKIVTTINYDKLVNIYQYFRKNNIDPADILYSDPIWITDI